MIQTLLVLITKAALYNNVCGLHSYNQHYYNNQTITLQRGRKTLGSAQCCMHDLDQDKYYTFHLKV